MSVSVCNENDPVQVSSKFLCSLMFMICLQTRQPAVTAGKKLRKENASTGVTGSTPCNSQMNGVVDLISSTPHTSSATTRRKGSVVFFPAQLLDVVLMSSWVGEMVGSKKVALGR